MKTLRSTSGDQCFLSHVEIHQVNPKGVYYQICILAITKAAKTEKLSQVIAIPTANTFHV